jgi:hypothetical protein
MQLSLFDENNILKNTFRKKMADFDLTGARKALRELSTKLDQTEDTYEKIDAVFDLQAALAAEEHMDAKTLAELSVRLEEIKYLRPLAPEFCYLKKGFMRAITQKIDDDPREYIIPELHPAEVYIETMQYDKAIKSAAGFIDQHGEHAFLRQLTGFAYHEKGNEPLSYKNLGLAFFHNPLQCRESFLPPNQIMDVLRDLKRRISNSELAWVHLPFELWKQEIITVSYDDINYIKCITDLISGVTSDATRDAVGNGLLFIRLLYLAEALRLQNIDHSKMIDLRARMKAIDPDGFDEYKEVIERTRAKRGS